ncbi:hypothetical protein [Leptolyngbya iicbica]|nr:hypothetical protein [Leptolyngbya sp. LK]
MKTKESSFTAQAIDASRGGMLRVSLSQTSVREDFSHETDQQPPGNIGS